MILSTISGVYSIVVCRATRTPDDHLGHEHDLLKSMRRIGASLDHLDQLYCCGLPHLSRRPGNCSQWYLQEFPIMNISASYNRNIFGHSEANVFDRARCADS